MIKKIIFSMLLLFLITSQSYATPLDEKICDTYIQKLGSILGLDIDKEKWKIYLDIKSAHGIETQEQFYDMVKNGCNKYNIYTKKELYVYYTPEPKIYEFYEAIENKKIIWLYDKDKKFICEIQK